jgi:hypothetical protein
MKRFSKYVICRTTGLCAALSMLIAVSGISVVMRVMPRRGSLIADGGAKMNNPSDSEKTEISVNEPVEIVFQDSEDLDKAYDACKDLMQSRNKKNKKNHSSEDKDNSADHSEIISDSSTVSTTEETAVPEAEQTTVTTTTPSQSTSSPVTAATTAAAEHTEESPRVSNGMKPFNYNDVSSVASEMKTLGDFAEKVSPSSLSWNTEEYAENGCVRITLQAESGMAVLDVRPVTPEEKTEYLIDGEKSGSVKGDQLGEWEWFEQNSSAGCNISSVTWILPDFGVRPVRGIDIGSGLAEVTDNYLCVNGGATTLYKASDVISDQNKLNAILTDENQYTFVGGRVYSIGSYLDKYYNGKEHSFLFEDCDYIVQYGCNSIMEHNYTTGSWIIEYAVKEDVVIGISFMNKSYYKNEPRPIVSTNSASGSESGANTARTEASSLSDDVISFEYANESSDVESGETEAQPDESAEQDNDETQSE